MTEQQMRNYKRNYVDNKMLEFVCEYNREPSVATMKKWSREADEKLNKMQKQVIKHLYGLRAISRG